MLIRIWFGVVGETKMPLITWYGGSFLFRILHRSVPSGDKVAKGVLRSLLEIRCKDSNHFLILASGDKGGDGR